MIRVNKIETTEGFANLRDDWSKLLETSQVKSGFLTWEWLFTWWEIFGKGNKLFLFTVWQDDRLVGIAPLMKTTRFKWGIPLRRLTNIGGSDCDITSFIVASDDDEANSALCSATMETMNSWDLFEMRETPIETFNSLLKYGCIPLSTFLIRSENTPHLFIPIDRDWDSFYKAQKQNLRNKHRKVFSRIEREGKTVKFLKLMGEEITEDHIEEIYKINEFGHFPEKYRSQEIQNFHHSLVARMRETGSLNLTFLFLDEKPVAYEYGFITSNFYEAWRMGFDTRYSDYSPGALLTLRTIEDMFNRKLKEVDLLRGLEGYKRNWLVQERMYTHFRIIRRMNWLTRFLLIHVPNLKRRIIRLFT
jgi:CelD/BcsL family acetyltransferase involved in cellulose biosynthesis